VKPKNSSLYCHAQGPINRRLNARHSMKCKKVVLNGIKQKKTLEVFLLTKKVEFQLPNTIPNEKSTKTSTVDDNVRKTIKNLPYYVIKRLLVTKPSINEEKRRSRQEIKG
jgi:hypothetical protein